MALQEIKTPDMLYEEVIEVEERVVLQQDKCQLKRKVHTVAVGTTSEKVGTFTSWESDM